MQILNHLNLNSNEIRNAKFEILATDPISPLESQFWYNSTSKKLKYYDGTSVLTVADLSNVIGLLEYKGTIDASGDPNYPAGETGDVYIFSVAGKIGGASGEEVEVGDLLICNTDNAGGTEASVGTNWDVIQKNLPSNIAKKYTQTGVLIGSIPDTVTITHNLNSKSVIVSVFDESNDTQVFPTIIHNGVNTIQIIATGATRTVTVTVIG